jgi:hypothetical protein
MDKAIWFLYEGLFGWLRESETTLVCALCSLLFIGWLWLVIFSGFHKWDKIRLTVVLVSVLPCILVFSGEVFYGGAAPKWAWDIMWLSGLTACGADGLWSWLYISSMIVYVSIIGPECTNKPNKKKRQMGLATGGTLSLCLLILIWVNYFEHMAKVEFFFPVGGGVSHAVDRRIASADWSIPYYT